MMVAYLLFASGQELLLHNPVTLCLFRQKFCVSPPCIFVETLKLQWWWLITCQIISSHCMMAKTSDLQPNCKHK